jgi:hypothetical protein
MGIYFTLCVLRRRDFLLFFPLGPLNVLHSVRFYLFPPCYSHRMDLLDQKENMSKTPLLYPNAITRPLPNLCVL